MDVGGGVLKSGRTVPETEKPHDAAADHVDHVRGGDGRSGSLGTQPHKPPADSMGSDDMVAGGRIRPRSTSPTEKRNEADRIQVLEAKVARMCDKFEVRVPRVMCCVETCHVSCWTRSV